MKTLADLEAIRKNALDNMHTRRDAHATKITVAMGTCGIAAGARDTMLAILDELRKDELHHVKLFQTGCMGMCQLEPIVEVEAEGAKTTYCKVTPALGRQIVSEHLGKGNVLADHTIDKYA